MKGKGWTRQPQAASYCSRRKTVRGVPNEQTKDVESRFLRQRGKRFDSVGCLHISKTMELYGTQCPMSICQIEMPDFLIAPAKKLASSSLRWIADTSCVTLRYQKKPGCLRLGEKSYEQFSQRNRSRILAIREAGACFPVALRLDPCAIHRSPGHR